MCLDLLLKSGTCVLPHPQGQGLIESVADVGIKNGKIVDIQTAISTPAKETISVQGLHILPGIIDSQVHFREPGMTHKEDLHTGSKAALLGGVTAFFEMPNTIPSTTTQELFEQKLKAAESRCYTHYAFYFGASLDNLQEIKKTPELKHCCGIKIFMGSSTGSLLVDRDDVLEQILQIVTRPVAVHCEDEARIKERKIIATESKNVHDHPLWRDETTALIATKKLVLLAEKCKKRVHVLHVSTAEEIDFLKAHKTNASVEVLPQHLTLWAPDCYDQLGNLAQQNPPIRAKRHHDKLWAAVLDGTIDIMGSDHAPHTLEEKNREYPLSPSGMPGVQTLVPIMLDHVNNKKLSLTRFCELVTEAPRKRFGIKSKGRLEIGFDADITIVDLKMKRKIENSWIASRCGWTPYDGKTVQGWPKFTILNGQICMREDQILLPPQGQGLNFETSVQ